MSNVISRLNSVLEGRYHVERTLGEGGMATVYLARDIRHDRNVAFKVLTPELAAAVGGERFLAEIRTTANLHHPHILPLHDSGEAAGFLFYVMPYVEGESLRERLDQEGQLPVEEAVRIASRMAEALEYAHEQGVVHRDIKPANVLMLRGEPLISDFGIALATGGGSERRLTETGLGLGTPYYTSPEQATGDERVGPTTDIYALGCVLYEMLVGEPPFTGRTLHAVLGKIITDDVPSAARLRRTVPAHVDAAIAKAVEKVPADRFSSAAAFRTALQDPTFRYTRPARDVKSHTGDPGHAVDPTQKSTAVRRATFLFTLAVAVVAAGVAAWALGRPGPSLAPVRMSLDLGDLRTASGAQVAVSPDGRTFAVAATAEAGAPRIWIRRADEVDFRPIAGTDGGSSPAFSPDGESLAFSVAAEDELRRIGLAGGTPLTVADMEPFQPIQAHWGDDGRIVFVAPDRGVFLVPEEGGVPVRLLEASGVDPYRNPRLLPGGRGLLLTDRLQEALLVYDLEAEETRLLDVEGVDGRYLPTGHLLFTHVRGGLHAAPFDLDALEVIGPSLPVVDGVVQRAGNAPYAVSREGTLVYALGGSSSGSRSRRLLLVDLEAGERRELGVPRGMIMGPRISPDGRSVAYATGEEDLQIHVLDMEAGGPPRQRTFSGNNIFPIWSPDGTRIGFNSRRPDTEGSDLFVVEAIGDESPRRILARDGIQSPTDWPTEERLVYEEVGEGETHVLDPATGETRLYLAPTAETGGSPSGQTGGVRIAPGGDYAVYGSESGTGPDVYLRSFPEPRQQVRVSVGGGAFPVWGPEGETVYHWRQDTLFAAELSGPPGISVRQSRAVLTDVDVVLPFWDLRGSHVVLVEDAPDPGLDQGAGTDDELRWLVVVNWFSELEARMQPG